MKKITAILLAVMLVLSLSATAFANETTGSTITVNGAVDNATYSLYKIFDVTTVNGSDAYAVPAGRDYSATKVTVNEKEYKFADLFETTTETKTDAEDKETTVTYVTSKSSNNNAIIIAWAKANIGSFGTATTETGDYGKVEFTGLEKGYYYVHSTVSNGAVAMIADTTQTATVVEKNSAPGWDNGDDKGGKEANDVTYYAGETITYTLTYYSAVNYDQGEKVTKYIIEDTLPAGITYGSDVSAKVNGQSVKLTTEATVDNGFKVSIPWTNDDGTSKYTVNPSTITVTYTATMGNTVIAQGITNKAKIYPDTYTGNPDDPDDPENPENVPERTETVYTGQIVLEKYDNSDEGKEDKTKPLSGAKFKVMVGDKYLKQDGDSYTEVAEADATVFVTGADGKITLAGLKAGTYTFVETEAPAGYNLPADPELAVVELKLDGEDASAMSKTQDVYNSKAAAMPETGGMGTTMFYFFGSLLFIGAAVLLITQKRMQSVR